MQNENEIINRVATSGLITFDLEQYHQPGPRILIDIKDQLFQGLILREKDFREYIKTTDWSQYNGAYVAITCTTEAIIPTWAYMLLSLALTPHAKRITFGNLTQLEEQLYHDTLSQLDWSHYTGAKVVIKGCSNHPVPVSAYIHATTNLQPYASSIMYGEPCSTVPLFKAKK